MRDITNGSLLMDYNIEKVESFSPSPDSPTQLRTLVVFATHKKYPRLELAIKITPIYLQGRREDFVREQQIHYLLTQLDAEAVRTAAATKTAKDKTLFVATREQPLEHEVAVIRAIAKTTHHNVVPLYDFVIQSFNINMIPQVEGRANLSRFTWLSDHPASILVQGRLNGTLYDLVQKKHYTLDRFIRVLRYVIIQVCCMLHSLMVIKFTHGDTHPRNVGWIGEDLERHYHVTKKRVFVIPSDVSITTMLLDFDNSRAEMKDATGKPFKMIPSATSLGARFRGVVKLTPDQTFSPMVDIFRLVHGVMRLLAQQMLAKDAKFDNVTLSQETIRLGTACRDGMTNIPQSIKDIAAYKTASEFYGALLDPSKTDETLKIAAGALERDGAQQEALWYRLYAATPSTIKDTIVYTMPWDVLKNQDPVDPNVTPLGGENMTLSPLYKPRKVYQPANVDVIIDNEIRVHPLKAAFPSEFQ